MYIVYKLQLLNLLKKLFLAFDSFIKTVKSCFNKHSNYYTYQNSVIILGQRFEKGNQLKPTYIHICIYNISIRGVLTLTPVNTVTQ